jgi:hypothetical protein
MDVATQWEALAQSTRRENSRETEYDSTRNPIIRNAHQKGRDASWAKDTLKALEASVRAFQNHRQLILDQLKSTKER